MVTYGIATHKYNLVLITNSPRGGIMEKQSYIQNEFTEDEISITDILGKLWRRRGIIFIITLLSVGLGITYILSLATAKRTPITLFVELTSIKDGKYPNGSAFSPMDLKTPDVLTVLIEKYKPADRTKFQNAIEISYGSDLIMGAHKSYEQQLSQKGLTSAEIQKINADYKASLDEIAHRGLQIIFDYQLAGLPKSEGKQIVGDIPRIWNEVYLKKYQVLLDPRISKIPNQTDRIAFDNAADTLEASQKISNIITGLGIITEDNRFSSLKNENGKTGFEILKDLEFFRNTHLLPMIASSTEKSDATAQAYSHSIQLDIDEIDRNIKSLNELSQEVVNYQKSSNNPSPSRNTDENIQLSDNTLSEILNLSHQAAMSDFLKDTLNTKRELAFKRSQLQSELDRLNGTNGSFDEAFKNTATRKMTVIFSDYREFVEKVRSSSAFNSKTFFNPLGIPESLDSKWPDKALLILLLSIFIGIILSALISLLLPEKAKSSSAR